MCSHCIQGALSNEGVFSLDKNLFLYYVVYIHPALIRLFTLLYVVYYTYASLYDYDIRVHLAVKAIGLMNIYSNLCAFIVNINTANLGIFTSFILCMIKVSIKTLV